MRSRWDAGLFPRHRPWRTRRRGLRPHRHRDRGRPGTALGAGLTAAAPPILASQPGTAGRRRPDRRPCRRHRHGRRRRCRRASTDPTQPPRLCLRHLGLHHDLDRRADLRPRRLGTVFLGHGAGPLAQRGRAVGGGRGARPSCSPAPRRSGAALKRAAADGKSADRMSLHDHAARLATDPPTRSVPQPS